MKSETVEILGDDLKLEGILELVSHASLEIPGPGVVLCHPHPLYGGRMDNNVTQAISMALANRGVTALRFNFRGVDRSEGTFDGGEGETRDALAAVSYLADREEVSPSRIGMMGYSFGGAIALKAALSGEEVKAVAAVSPAGLPVFEDHPVPRLIICGSRDEIVSTSAILEEEEDIKGASGAGHIQLVDGADHFWWGYEEKLGQSIANFFENYL